METQTRNAMITYLQWNLERGLSHLIGVKIENTHWAFGGYNLRGTRCAKWVRSIANTFDLESFDDDQMIGNIVRIKTDENNRVVSIGHPIKDQWMVPEEILN